MQDILFKLNKNSFIPQKDRDNCKKEILNAQTQNNTFNFIAWFLTQKKIFRKFSLNTMKSITAN